MPYALPTVAAVTIAKIAAVTCAELRSTWGTGAAPDGTRWPLAAGGADAETRAATALAAIPDASNLGLKLAVTQLAGVGATPDLIAAIHARLTTGDCSMNTTGIGGAVTNLVPDALAGIGATAAVIGATLALAAAGIALTVVGVKMLARTPQEA